MPAKEIVPDRPGPDDPGRGRRLGIDVGTVRIGIAVSDPDGILATPVTTITRVTKRKSPDREDIDEILDLIAEYQVVEIVMGLPRMLDGTAGSSVRHAQDIAFRIHRRLQKTDSDLPIRFVDERMTTVLATHALHMSGVDTKKGRKVIDQAAAVEILQAWLDERKAYLERCTEPESYPEPMD